MANSVTPLHQAIDADRNPLVGTYGIPSYVGHLHFTGAAVQSYQAPVGATRVLFKNTGHFYVSTGTAAVPTGNITDGSASDLDPPGYVFGGQPTFSIAVAAACEVQLLFFS